MGGIRAGPVRVSVLASNGRLDLRLPADVSVAEVSAELSARLGLDSDLALCSVLGAPLDPDHSIGAQITDGAVLQLIHNTAVSDVAVHDDVGEAIRAAQVSDAPLGAVATRAASIAGCGLALVVAVVAALVAPVSSALFVGSVAIVLFGAAIWCSATAPAWAALFGWAGGAYAAAAVHIAGQPTMSVPVETTLIAALFGTGCAIIILPRLALAVARLHNGLEGRAVSSAVARGHRALLIGVEGVGVALVLLVPIGVRIGPAGALMAVNVVIGFLLLARSLPGWEIVCADLLLGSVALFAGILVALDSHETWRMPSAVAGVLAAIAFALCGFAPDRLRLRLTWLADGGEWVTRFLLVPLGVWAVGLPSQALGGMTW